MNAEFIQNLPTAEQAIARLRELGMPRRNNELWSFFPVAKIPTPEFMGTDFAAAPMTSPAATPANQETDFAALLPIANNARPMVREIVNGAAEMAMLKCNNDFGHTVLDIGKGAKVSLEILDNKVAHDIAAERFDINVGENADVEIFFANPACDLPLRFRHFNINQAAGANVRFSSICKDTAIGRVSVECNATSKAKAPTLITAASTFSMAKPRSTAASRFTTKPRAPQAHSLPAICFLVLHA